MIRVIGRRKMSAGSSTTEWRLCNRCSVFTATLFLTAILFPTNNALRCACSDCESSHECTVEHGGACYSKVMTLGNEIVAHQTRCFDKDIAESQCNFTSHPSIKIDCCYEDLCNLNATFGLNSAVSPTTTTSDTPDDSTPDPIFDLDPTESHVSKVPSESPASINILLCHKYKTNSSNLKKNSTCTTSAGSCFHLVRKHEGRVRSEVWGCAENCKEENRNRAVRTCCTTTLCNKIISEEEESLIAPSSSQNPGVILTTSTANQQITLVPVFNSKHVPPSSSVTRSISAGLILTDHVLLSSVLISTVSTTRVLPSTSTLQYSALPSSNPQHISSTTSSFASSSNPEVIRSTRSSSTVLKPSTSTLSNFLSASSTSPSLSSASKAYLIASASLGALYIIVFVALCSLIGIVCYKQRNLILKGDTKNNARSTDTLTSTSA